MRPRRHRRVVFQATRAAVLERDGYRCQIRGPKCKGRASTVDHVVPIVEGGSDDAGNLRAACGPCNSAGGAAITNSRRRARGASRRW